MSQLTPPQSVALKITAKGWTWKVLDQEEGTIVKHTMNMESRGSARGKGKGDIYDRIRDLGGENYPGWMKLAEALEDGNAMDIAGCLMDAADEYGEGFHPEVTP